MRRSPIALPLWRSCSPPRRRILIRSRRINEQPRRCGHVQNVLRNSFIRIQTSPCMPGSGRRSATPCGKSSEPALSVSSNSCDPRRPPSLLSSEAYPRLDPKRVLRAYKKLGIASVGELRSKLESGEVEQAVGSRLTQHIRQGITETHAMLLYRAHELRHAVEDFLLDICKVRAAESTGDYRRRVETIEELSFIVETDDFSSLIGRLERYGGRPPLITSTQTSATLSLSSGVQLRIDRASKLNWGLSLIECTGSKAHLRKLTAVIGGWDTVLKGAPFRSERNFYDKFNLSFIEPEL